MVRSRIQSNIYTRCRWQLGLAWVLSHFSVIHWFVRIVRDVTTPLCVIYIWTSRVWIWFHILQDCILQATVCQWKVQDGHSVHIYSLRQVLDAGGKSRIYFPIPSPQLHILLGWYSLRSLFWLLCNMGCPLKHLSHTADSMLSTDDLLYKITPQSEWCTHTKESLFCVYSSLVSRKYLFSVSNSIPAWDFSSGGN